MWEKDIVFKPLLNLSLKPGDEVERILIGRSVVLIFALIAANSLCDIDTTILTSIFSPIKWKVLWT